MSSNREHRAAIARETLALVEAGSYVTPGGERIEIGTAVDACIAGTRLVLPGTFDSAIDGLAARAPRAPSPTIEVRNEGTLVAAQRLAAQGFTRVGVLNFASARNPGGGFLSGSQAQEESLARSSALYASLTSAAAAPYYEHHRAEASLLYSDRVIVSPACPVFRDAEGRLLAAPHHPTFLTCAAPNAGAVAASQPERLADIPAVFARRAVVVLHAALDAGCDAVVLGAWGCGVFRNDPVMVARQFGALLAAGSASVEAGIFGRQFRHVAFAVLDATPGQACLQAFERAFATGRPGTWNTG